MQDSRMATKRTIEVNVTTDALFSDGDDLAEEMRRWDAYQRDGKSVGAEEVDAWIDSLGTKSPLQKPRS